MRDITAKVLLEMKDSVTWRNLKKRRGYTGDPTEWDINCGYCDTWAEMASEVYGGEPVWLDELNPNFGEDGLDVSHCVLILNDRYYDSQHPDGVDSPWDMDIVNKVSRKKFLEKRNASHN